MVGLLLVHTARGQLAGANAPGVEIAERRQVESTAPDLSGLTPGERFDRLYNRVMQAAQGGDEGGPRQGLELPLPRANLSAGW